MATVLERVVKVIVENLDVPEDQVIPEASLTEDLGADSLDMVQLTMSLGDEFTKDGQPLDIADEDAETIVKVQDAVDYLVRQGFTDES